MSDQPAGLRSGETKHTWLRYDGDRYTPKLWSGTTWQPDVVPPETCTMGE